MLNGLLGGLAAALCYGAASVVQAFGVRQLSLVAAGESWTVRLWTARWYGAGLALDGLGFLASVVALRTLPLFLVQALVASSLGITAVLAATFLSVSLNRQQIVALAVLAVGLTTLASSAPEQPAQGLTGAGSWLLLATVVPLVAVTAAAGHGQRQRQRTFMVLTVCAGLGFTGVAVAARALVVPESLWLVLREPTLWALVGFAAQSAICYALALSRGSVTVATAVALGTETVVAGVFGLLFLGDHTRPGWGPFAAIGFVLAIGGCLILARRPLPPSTQDAQIPLR